MTGFSRGDVLLVNFIFADETGTKHRPAVIISSQAYHTGRAEVVIAAITSRIDRVKVGDHIIADWQRASLLFPSVATGIIRTIKANMVDRKLGSITHPDMEAIDSKLRLILDLL